MGYITAPADNRLNLTLPMAPKIVCVFQLIASAGLRTIALRYETKLGISSQFARRYPLTGRTFLTNNGSGI